MGQKSWLKTYSAWDSGVVRRLGDIAGNDFEQQQAGPVRGEPHGWGKSLFMYSHVHCGPRRCAPYSTDARDALKPPLSASGRRDAGASPNMPGSSGHENAPG